MRQGGRLESEVGSLVVSVRCRSGEHRLNAGDVPKLVACSGIGTPKDFGVQTDNVLQPEVYGLLSRIWQSLASAVVRLEDTKRLAVFTDSFSANSSDTSTDLVRRGDKQLTGGKLFNKDLAIGVITEALDPMGKGHDIAITDSPNLHDLHER
jgi:hypothetical protein